MENNMANEMGTGIVNGSLGFRLYLYRNQITYSSMGYTIHVRDNLLGRTGRA